MNWLYETVCVCVCMCGGGGGGVRVYRRTKRSVSRVANRRLSGARTKRRVSVAACGEPRQGTIDRGTRPVWFSDSLALAELAVQCGALVNAVNRYVMFWCIHIYLLTGGSDMA